MKKTAIIILITVMLFSFSSCNLKGIIQKFIPHKVSSQNINANSSAATNLISESQAISIVKDKVHYNASNIIYDVDTTEVVGLVKYYVVHVYENVSDDANTSHTATFGWYDVDTVTGKLLERVMALENVLLPLDNITLINEDETHYNSSSKTALYVLTSYFTTTSSDNYLYSCVIKRDGISYYLVYYISTNSSQEQVTRFYCINVETRKILQWDIANDTLVKLN